MGTFVTDITEKREGEVFRRQLTFEGCRWYFGQGNRVQVLISQADAIRLVKWLRRCWHKISDGETARTLFEEDNLDIDVFEFSSQSKAPSQRLSVRRDEWGELQLVFFAEGETEKWYFLISANELEQFATELQVFYQIQPEEPDITDQS